MNQNNQTNHNNEKNQYQNKRKTNGGLAQSIADMKAVEQSRIDGYRDAMSVVSGMVSTPTKEDLEKITEHLRGGRDVNVFAAIMTAYELGYKKGKAESKTA